MKPIREKIIQVLKDSGRTRNSLCVEFGFDRAQLSRLANGKPGVSLEVIEQVAAALGYEIVIVPTAKAATRTLRPTAKGAKRGKSH